MLCRPPNHCLKPPSACTLARSHGMGSALSPCPAFLSPTFSLYPLAVSPCLKGLWEERGLFSSSDKSTQPIFPQNRLAISRVPAGKGCGPITQTMPSASLLWIKTRLRNALAIKQRRALVCVNEASLPAQTFHRQTKSRPLFVKTFIHLPASPGPSQGAWISAWNRL